MDLKGLGGKVQGKAEELQKIRVTLATIVGIEQVVEAVVLLVLIALYPHIVCSENLQIWTYVYTVLSILLMVFSVWKWKKTSEAGDMQSLIPKGGFSKAINLIGKIVHVIALLWVGFGSYCLCFKHGMCSENNFTLVIQILVIAYWVKFLLFIIYSIAVKLVFKV